MNKPTQEYIRSLFTYDELTGIFVRRVSRGGTARIGTVAGSTSTAGYRQIMVDGKNYSAHLLAWLYVYGYFPENQLDHKDRIRHHNWISNLREATQTCNMRNAATPSTNTSGVKGVHFEARTSKWCARITLNRKGIALGRYSCFVEAVCHRLAAEQAEGWESCDSASPAHVFVSEYLCAL